MSSAEASAGGAVPEEVAVSLEVIDVSALAALQLTAAAAAAHHPTAAVVVHTEVDPTGRDAAAGAAAPRLLLA